MTEEIIEYIKQKLMNQLKSYGDFLGTVEYNFNVEMKYRGQIHELSIPISEEDIAHDDISAEDQFILNDPYLLGIQTTDVLIAKPIFFKDQLVCWVGSLPTVWKGLTKVSKPCLIPLNGNLALKFCITPLAGRSGPVLA